MEVTQCQELVQRYWTPSSEERNFNMAEIMDAVKMLVEYDDLELEDDVEMLSNRWSALMVDEDEKQKEEFEKSKKEQGRKLFVGNLASENDAPMSWETLLLFSLVALKFGPIERIRHNREKRFCFLLYEKMDDAVPAYEVLRPFETRRDVIAYLHQSCGEEYQTFLPKTNFYCRWPKDARHLEITRNKTIAPTIAKADKRVKVDKRGGGKKRRKGKRNPRTQLSSKLSE